MAHITRFEAPWFLKVSKKEYKWVVRASPGPHSLQRSIPLAVLIRDYLNYAKTLKEAKRVISSGIVYVDGRPRKNYKYPVGLMDVIYLKGAEKYYRIVPDIHRVLMPVEISKDEATYKLVRIVNKTTVKSGKIQLNLEDGRNILLSAEEARNYKTFETLKIEIPSQKVLDKYELTNGNYAVIIGGRNVGNHGNVDDVAWASFKRVKYTIVTLTTPSGTQVRTNMMNVMAVGREKPEVKLL
jgi:small subunit ribosomal protein S4e